MVRKSLCLGLVVVSTLVFACGSSSNREGFEDGTGNGSAPGADQGTGNNESTSLGTEPPPAPPPEPEECTKMDIVFVVDDSGSMAEEQTNLAANVPKFVSKIDSFKTKGGSKLDWRIAVTTTARDITYNIQVPLVGTLPQSEKGDDGAFRMTPACKTTKRWVEKSDPNAAKDFQCLAKAGTGGSSLEMPLYATKLALNDRMADGTNAGFLRPDALLA
ncbi:MAG: putative lipoprotein, partial [Labilithrix sp.]|nr:putative lipoprotein [Labilithrix sp.]